MSRRETLRDLANMAKTAMQPKTKATQSKAKMTPMKAPAKTKSTQANRSRVGRGEILVTKNEKTFHTRRCHYVENSDKERNLHCTKCVSCSKLDDKSDADWADSDTETTLWN